ncbi:hypothetical protein UPYG_G00156110 [Umbra pygmaea]|uniref:Uncharacterized protein n=1 Tax=Umbra pygmaea TaxID=75934 RepID=A0ABD0WYN2_UMBPY
MPGKIQLSLLAVYLHLHLAVSVQPFKAQTPLICYRCSGIDCAFIDLIHDHRNDLTAWNRDNDPLPCSNTATPTSNKCSVCYSNQEINIVCDPEIKNSAPERKGKAITTIKSSCPILAGGESKGQTISPAQTPLICYRCSGIDCAFIDLIHDHRNDLTAWNRDADLLPCSNTATPTSNKCSVCYSNQEINIVCDPEIKNPAPERKGKAITTIKSSCPILAGGESKGQTISPVNFTTSSPAETGSLSNDVSIAVLIGVSLGVISVIGVIGVFILIWYKIRARKQRSEII